MWMLFKNKTYIWLFIVFGIGLFSYFLPGDLLELDAHSHLARTWLFKDILLHEGHFPIWTNRWYFGYPIGLYYGFLYYLLSAFFAALSFGHLVFGTKLFLWTVHILSGFAIYALVYRLLKSNTAAFFSAFLYVFSPEHLGTILQEGRFPLSLIFLWMPLTFYVLEKAEEEISEKQFLSYTAQIAFLLALSLFTHLQFGFYCLFGFCLVLSLRILFDFSKSAIRIKIFLCTLLFYLGLTAWILIPAIQDAPFLMQGDGDNLIVLFGSFKLKKIPSIFSQLFWNHNQEHSHLFYIGFIPLILLGLSWKGREKAKIAYFSYLGAFFLGFLLFLRVERFIYTEFFFFSLLCGYGILGLKRVASQRIKQAILPILLLLFFLEIAPFFRLSPYKSIKNNRVKEAQVLLNQRGQLGRILSLKKTRGTLWASLDVIDTNASTPFGGIPQTATRPYPYATSIASQAAKEFYDEKREFSNTTQQAFRLLDVEYVLVPEKPYLLPIDGASPLWFVNSPKPFLKKYTSLERENWFAMRAKYDERKLDFSPIRAFLQNANMEKIAIYRFEESHSQVLIEYESKKPGWLWLSYAYFPYNHVKIDGHAAKVLPSFMNFMLIPTLEGRHMLVVSADISFTRKCLILFAILTLFSAIFIPQFSRSKKP